MNKNPIVRIVISMNVPLATNKLRYELSFYRKDGKRTTYATTHLRLSPALRILDGCLSSSHWLKASMSNLNVYPLLDYWFREDR